MIRLSKGSAHQNARSSGLSIESKNKALCTPWFRYLTLLIILCVFLHYISTLHDTEMKSTNAKICPGMRVPGTNSGTRLPGQHGNIRLLGQGRASKLSRYALVSGILRGLISNADMASFRFDSLVPRKLSTRTNTITSALSLRTYIYRSREYIC